MDRFKILIIIMSLFSFKTNGNRIEIKSDTIKIEKSSEIRSLNDSLRKEMDEYIKLTSLINNNHEETTIN